MIKAVLFDIYGTLLDQEQGDLADLSKKKKVLLESFKKTGKKYKLKASAEELLDIFTISIKKIHKIKKSKGIKYPEVKIEQIWNTILKAVKYKYTPDFIYKIAHDHTDILTKKSLYPHTPELLVTLKMKGIHLGIISNSQFYTEIDMDRYLKKDIEIKSLYDLFDPKSCIWSYKIGEAKPSPNMFIPAVKRLNQLGIKPEETLFVGNNIRTDIAPAKKAGFKTCLTINKQTRNTHLKTKPDYKIKKLIEISDIVEKDRRRSLSICCDELMKLQRYKKLKRKKTHILYLIRNLFCINRFGSTQIIGIQGGQGTGKTTFANFLHDLCSKLGYRVTTFSIDDFYETRKNRLRQSKQLNNPFYAISRGMPGTHKYKLLKKTIEKIKKGQSVELPIFDKSLHDGYGDVAKKKIKIQARQDFVLFEGWCVGVPYATSTHLDQICKKNHVPLRRIDPQLKYCKTMLAFTKKYQPIWKLLDFMIVFQAKNASLHYKWRIQQEREMKKIKGESMTKEKVIKFVDIFIPITYLCYEDIKPDLKFIINSIHEYHKVIHP